MSVPETGNGFSKKTELEEVIRDPAFEGWGHLLFPVQKGYMTGRTLGDLSFTWYSRSDPDKTVEICSYLKQEVLKGKPVFFPLYTPEDCLQDPSRKDTGLILFRGRPGSPFAICCAGGGFCYEAAMQDSFPQALEISRLGYTAFALIYRPEPEKAIKDLARAADRILRDAQVFRVSPKGFSVWGGSAGARLAAWLGRYGPRAFGGVSAEKPAAVIMQYTGLSDWSRQDPPTFSCVGNRDGIADWRIMKKRAAEMKKAGIDTEFHVYPGLGHGFGLGTGTCAQGWIGQAVRFWQDHIV